MSSRKLVSKGPFIKGRIARVNGVVILVGWIVVVCVVLGSGIDSGPGFCIFPSMYPESPFDASS